ncbi:MAG: DUF4810 domain-containing protein [Deltaproteobacteria bacterium]|nr:DUF4810 domain-containing protein [Deltaproteobacteria bacterium]
MYEDSLYQLGVRGTGDPATQVVRLAADVTRTDAEHQRVPPGVHAHLGWLLYSIGRVDEARAHLDAERALYPESAKMIDTMLEKISGAKPAGALALQVPPSQASEPPVNSAQAPASQGTASEAKPAQANTPGVVK